MAKSKTKVERDWMSKVAQISCLACELIGYDTPQVQLHHITTRRGFGGRSKHQECLPICFQHHLGGGRGVAIHDGVELWEKNFKPQEELLQILYRKMGVTEEELLI